MSHSRGQHEGDYVPCHAEKHCRIAGGSQHVIFNGSKEMNAYNTMSSMAPEFADGSRLEYAVSGYGTGSGGFRGVRGDGLDLDKAYNDTRRISMLLKNGQPMVDARAIREPNDEISDDDVALAEDETQRMQDVIWGMEHGLKSSAAGRSETVQMRGCTVTAENGWRKTIERGYAIGEWHRSGVPMNEARSVTFSNGRTLMTVSNFNDETADQYDPQTRTVNAMTREHPDCMISFHHDPGNLTLKDNRIGDEFNTIAEKTKAAYGSDASLTMDMTGPRRKDIGIRVTHYNRSDDSTVTDRIPFDDFIYETGLKPSQFEQIRGFEAEGLRRS